VAEEGADARRHRRALAGEVPRQEDRHRALQRVAEEGGERQPLAAGPQHVGGADVARADLADVAEPGGARQDEAEGDRAEAVAEDEGDENREHG